MSQSAAAGIVFKCRACDGEPTPPPPPCDACEGEGEIECKCECGRASHEMRCEECRGRGTAKPEDPCPCCGGTGDHLGGVCMEDLGGADGGRPESPRPWWEEVSA